MIVEINIAPCDNALCRAYNLLTPRTKKFVKANIIDGCEISVNCFYDWLKEPERISKPNRRIVANAFHKEVSELFPKNT